MRGPCCRNGQKTVLFFAYLQQNPCSANITLQQVHPEERRKQQAMASFIPIASAGQGWNNYCTREQTELGASHHQVPVTAQGECREVGAELWSHVLVSLPCPQLKTVPSWAALIDSMGRGRGRSQEGLQHHTSHLC